MFCQNYPQLVLGHLPPFLLHVHFPGEYAGFDESQPTAESGGKGKVISMLKEQYGLKTVVMIGDGATDLEACPPAVSVSCYSVFFSIFRCANMNIWQLVYKYF